MDVARRRVAAGRVHVERGNDHDGLERRRGGTAPQSRDGGHEDALVEPGGPLVRVDLKDVGDARQVRELRRDAGGRRQLDPDRWSPPWSTVTALLKRVPASVVKVAPGLDHDRVPDRVAHPADLAVAALAQPHFDPVGGNRAPEAHRRIAEPGSGDNPAT